jgi:hypothetical protein
MIAFSVFAKFNICVLLLMYLYYITRTLGSQLKISIVDK